MASPGTDQYLKSKILTAPPHRLHMLLIEGAIRFARQAKDAFERGDTELTSQHLFRAVNIVGEMLLAVRDSKSELNQNQAQLYIFVLRRLAESRIEADASKLAEVLDILTYERETWQIFCSRREGQPAESAIRKPKPVESARSTPGADASPPRANFSMEA